MSAEDLLNVAGSQMEICRYWYILIVHYLINNINMTKEIAVGLKKGFPVEKREKVVRPSHTKAVRRFQHYEIF